MRRSSARCAMPRNTAPTSSPHTTAARGYVSAPKTGDENVTATTSSSSCVSMADTATTTAMTPHRRRRWWKPMMRSEAVLEGWAKRMCIVDPGAARRRAAAARAPGRGRGARSAAARHDAAVLWREVAAHSIQEAGGDALRRLEACARVPARRVMAVASSMGRARVKLAAALDTEEGWGAFS
ncbi:hypothetical protein ACQ4PT_050754 [Festuca glaucescens]